MKKTLSIALLALVMLGVIACGSSKDIQGKWKHDATDAIYEFKSDGVFVLTNGDTVYEGTYEVDDAKTHVAVYIVVEGDTVSQTSMYQIDGKKMTMTSPDNGATITLTKQ